MRKLFLMIAALLSMAGGALAQSGAEEAAQNSGQPLDTIIDTIDEARDYLANMDTLYFSLADSRFDAGYIPAMQKLAKIMIDNPRFVLFIKSYGDAGGDSPRNQQLGSMRAVYIRGYLAVLGVKASSMQSASLGVLPNTESLPYEEYLKKRAYATFEIHER